MKKVSENEKKANYVKLNIFIIATARAVWINVSVHGVSFFLMIIDVIFNRMKIPIRMILFVLATVAIYMCLAFVVYAT